jgi:16S rRNA G966 N2-methylase RsmD
MPETTAAARPTLTSIATHLYVRDIRTSIGVFITRLGFNTDFVYGDPPFYAQVSRDQAHLALRSTDEPVFVRDTDENLLSASITLATAAEIQQLFADYQAAGVPFHQR